ncbi:DUF2505 domain-containing protein [Trueperella bialowiezensis]|uniref:Protein of uncharacterized function (DUF2505) n=1 Tax=Trueperella bialowiezensis TaxID=312285 RepID=A0A3S4VGX1_9ACTO|nr:DUF2505 domain-containing protein [Trueperella bialowiezensis]VEI13819.1 Protein of uncharacterised function (DUF2505) [Trueperella bialowiezensis]
MKFESETSYVGPIDLALSVLGSEELFRKRAQAVKFGGEISYSGDPNKHTVTAQIPGDEMPAAARSFLSGGVQLRVVGKATTLDQPGVHGASLSYDISVKGAPASGSLHIILADAGATTPAKVTGEINVNVPFVGGRIEKAAIEQVGKVLGKDTNLVNEEIARRLAG